MMRRAIPPNRSISLVSVLVLCANLYSQQSRTVEVQMRNVNLHLNSFTVLEIKTLRGEMVPTRADRPVTFDDPNSFVTRISTAEIAISTRTLSDLLNNYVLAYRGAPLKHVAVKADMGRIKETGTIHKGIDIPFEITGAIEPTPTGAIRLHADGIRSAHIPVKGLLHLFGEDLSKLINLKQDRGLSVEGDDIILYPGRMLPSPRIEGTVTAIRIQNDRIVLSSVQEGQRILAPRTPH